jgi:hypothetical protein
VTGLAKSPVNELDAALNSETGMRDVISAVENYLVVGKPEIDVLKCAAAVAVAYALDGEDPLWAVIIGPSSGMKTEIIDLHKLLADATPDEITRAGLLNWGKAGDHVKQMGLLSRIPEHSFVTVADFSTVVTMGDREARGRIFSALRRVYDGALSREIAGGADAELEWHGHLTLLMAATPVFDSHSSAEASLGERWLLYRLPEAETERSLSKSRYVCNRKDLSFFRRQAQETMRLAVESARENIPEHLSDDSIDRLAHAATLCAYIRTGVPFEGQGKYRVVMGEVSPEEPTRLVGQLDRLARCLMALGEEERVAVDMAVKTATDSVPRTRMAAMRHVIENGETSVRSLQAALKRGNFYSCRWELEALDAIGLVERIGDDDDDDIPASLKLNKYPTYVPTDDAMLLWGRCTNVGQGTPIRGGEMGNGNTSAAPLEVINPVLDGSQSQNSVNPVDDVAASNGHPAVNPETLPAVIAASTKHLLDQNGRCARHPDGDVPWCLECTGRDI